jgi:hypothetical protein
MAQADIEQPSENGATPGAEIQLESGTYEIIRNRLLGFSRELRDRLGKLNEARKQVFGAIDTSLLGTERVSTDHNCTPRDMVAIGNLFIFGYNVQFGLKNETAVEDVFSVYEFRDGTFHRQSLELIEDSDFQKDFGEIYNFYKKNAQFNKFFVVGAHLYMAFQVGKTKKDVKCLKWLIGDESLNYIDNRSEHEAVFPSQHEFQWTRTHRDLQQKGLHPHISIEDRVYVETIGGDLTIKVENNTASGEGIYSEPVDNPDQTLDDAEIFFAVLGNIVLLKIRPYQEERFRYFIYNGKIQHAWRVDSLEDSCILLPDDHGVIFANGYSLQTGEHKVFENDLRGMIFERRVEAPNGEDYLYIFYNRDSGTYVHLHYNLIAQQLETPLVCHGATIFPAGEMICFKAQPDPQKHHALQIWQTPYVADDFVPSTNTDSFLYKVGNKEIVRGMAESYEVISLVEKEDTYADLYVDLVRKSGDIVDSYFWLTEPDCFNLAECMVQIRDAAASAIDEFDKVVRVKQNTAQQTSQARSQTTEILHEATHRRFELIDDFVSSLGDLRAVRGQIISLKDLRYSDETLITQLEDEVIETTERLSQRCVEFLLRDDSLDPYKQRIEADAARIEEVTTVAEARSIGEAIAEGATELEMLIDIVSNLAIEDATHRTQIIDTISAIFGNVNSARAGLKSRIKELMSVEGVAEFGSQMKLLNQSVVNYLDICDSPEKCEEFLTKVMIQLEELEGRFAEFDEFVVQLIDKREEVYNAFETRKLSLVEARNKRANSLMNAADRILKGIKARVESFESVDEIHSYFASDLMIEKVRDIVDQLAELDDSVRVDDIQSRLKSIREDATRQLKDRQELFVDGENVIKMGDHHFNVNVQALDLTTVLRDDQMQLHLTGTKFFETIDDEQLLATRDVWQQEVVSENPSVYRGEYLAWKMAEQLKSSTGQKVTEFVSLDAEGQLEEIRRFMGTRYSEAYAKGVHDEDARQILAALLEMESSIDLLRYHTQARAMARVFWSSFGDPQEKALVEARLAGVGTISQLFPDSSEQQQYVAILQPMLQSFLDEYPLFPPHLLSQATNYLFQELTRGGGFLHSEVAGDLAETFQQHLKNSGFSERFADSIAAVEHDPAAHFVLLRDWVEAFLASRETATVEAPYADELAALLMEKKLRKGQSIKATVDLQLEGMIGSHPVIEGRVYQLNYNEFITRLEQFEADVVPRYRSYIDIKKEIVERARENLRLEEFRPRVLTSFVRNRLIDSVYLPLIGNNLAKQMGVAGEDKRTDRMGLLLLVSPPGYGKTTLMEYIANRLGIIFMKVNGPAIGHQVTSLDPVEAPNASAREEIAKLNLALEMGDNVMIYVDDIQHCNTEFLQKFISLCDATRRIEGVYKGRTRTYDLRGRKVCVVMAGNPYTESGEKFQIPDMLANRADIYNLGEIIGDTAEAFELSYLENSLTSNPALNVLASRSQQDVYGVIKMAQHDSREGVDLEGNYSLEELNEMVEVMKKLLRVRDVILSVNREYIRSAAQADEYRTEPPFKLQGSYRNMNRITEKVVAIMNDEELERLILTNYENDAQTLTSDTESNLLKVKELIGVISPEEAQRWEDIKYAYVQSVKLKGVGSDDKVGQVILQLGNFRDGLREIRETLAIGIETLAEQDQQPQEATPKEMDAPVASEELSSETADALIKLSEELRNYTTGMIPVDMDKPVQRVSVMHKVPRSILNVMQSQFDVMNDWMKPILAASEDNAVNLTQLQKSVDACLENYTQLLEELEQAGDLKERAGKKSTPRKRTTAEKKPATKKKPARKKPPPPPPPVGSDS